MKIAGVEYDAEHSALEIYIAGCTRRCKGCHNEELWAFDAGAGVSRGATLAQGDSKLVERFHILGGEPLDQNIVELESLLVNVWLRFPDKPIVLFTSYNIEEVPLSILQYCTMVKTGRYDENSDPITFGEYTLASSNQCLYASATGRPPSPYGDYHFKGYHGKDFRAQVSRPSGNSKGFSSKEANSRGLAGLLKKAWEALTGGSRKPTNAYGYA